MANDTLLRFYAGTGIDDRGRRIDEIWSFSRDELERVHDYIQWLFPLDEPSAFNPRAPLLDAATIERFRTDARLRENVERSLDVMRAFYASEDWITPHNHNFLRLTRILKSLSLLGFDERAAELLSWLEEIYTRHSSSIGTTTLEYWRAAGKAHPSSGRAWRSSGQARSSP